MTDEQNPEYMFQGASTELLLKAAKGEISLTQLAKAELANRGLGLRGEWIGFPAAKRYWDNTHAVRSGNGKMIMVSIPE
jgi:hypothetical protein